MKKNCHLFIFFCIFTTFVNASYPPGDSTEAAYEPLHAFEQEGITKIRVPDTNTFDHLLFNEIVDSSITLQNMKKDTPQALEPGNTIPFPGLGTKQVNALIDIVRGGHQEETFALKNPTYLKKTIEQKALFTKLPIIRTAEYLDIPPLLQAVQDEVANNLKQQSTLKELNQEPKYIPYLLSFLSTAMQKEIARKIITPMGYTKTHDFEFLFWDPVKRQTHTYFDPTYSLNSDGSRIVFYKNYKENGRVVELQKEGKVSELTKFDKPLSNAQFNPTNSDIIAFNYEQEVYLLNIKTMNKIILEHSEDERWIGKGLKLLTFDATGERLATFSRPNDVNTIKIWNTNTGKLQHEVVPLELNTLSSGKNIKNTVAFNPGDPILMAIGAEKYIVIWNLQLGNAQRKFNFEDKPERIVFDHAGKKLAVATDSNLSVINLTDGKKLERQEPRTLAMNFLPDNKLTFITGDKQLREWNLATNTIENSQQLSTFGRNPVFTPDLSVVAATSTNFDNPNRVFIWKNNKFALESLPLKELITFMIAKELGSNQINWQLRFELQKLPQAVQSLIEKK